MSEDNQIVQPEASRQGVFNMAIATLVRLDSILTDIKIVSCQVIPNAQDIKEMGRALETKRRLIWQFYTQATPLLTITQQQKLLPQYNVIQISLRGLERHYQAKEEQELDLFLIAVQDCLQDNNLFMPSKNDPNFAFRRD